MKRPCRVRLRFLKQPDEGKRQASSSENKEMNVTNSFVKKQKKREVLRFRRKHRNEIVANLFLLDNLGVDD